jgi:hypothetical protein
MMLCILENLFNSIAMSHFFKIARLRLKEELETQFHGVVRAIVNDTMRRENLGVSVAKATIGTLSSVLYDFTGMI